MGLDLLFPPKAMRRARPLELRTIRVVLGRDRERPPVSVHERPEPIYRGDHGRVVRLGQLWRSIDPRRLGAVWILAIHLEDGCATVQHLLTGTMTRIALTRFTIGSRGFSLERDVSTCR